MRLKSWLLVLVALLLETGSGCPIHAISPPSVDLGIQELDRRYVRSIAWRTEGKWWAVADVHRWDRPRPGAPHVHQVAERTLRTTFR